MKRLVSATCLAVALLLLSCGGERKPLRTSAEPLSYNDSLSYATGMVLSLGVAGAMDEIPPTCREKFVEGVLEAYNDDLSPESQAYAQGLAMGAFAMQKLAEARSEYGADGVIDARYFLEGLMSVVKDRAEFMFLPQAQDLCNRHLYLPASKRFIERNTKRANVVTLESGLQYKIDVHGTGAVASMGDQVRCIYKASYPDGTLFATSGGEPELLLTYKVLPGLAEALCMFPEGTVCTLYVPWSLGYGASGERKARPYAVLVYELEILEVVKNRNNSGK